MGEFERLAGYSVSKEGYKSGAVLLNKREALVASYALKLATASDAGIEKAALKAGKKRNIGSASLARVLEFLRRETSGFSFLDSLLHDAAVEEIIASDGQPVRVYLRGRGWKDCDVAASSGQKLVDLANKMGRKIGRRLTLQYPVLSANLDYGRLHAMMPPLSERVELSIRRFNSRPFSPPELIDLKTATAEALALLWLCVQGDSNLLICGNTGSGKTSLLNALLSFVPLDERVVAIEETPEVVIPQKNNARLISSRIAGGKMSDLVASSLRMRPDRIVIGEVRTPGEAAALADSMLAGQGKGSLATLHAGSAREALTRLASLGVNPADLSAIDLIITQKRWTRFSPREDLRRIIEICAVSKEYDSARPPEPVPVFLFDARAGALKPADMPAQVTEKLALSLGSPARVLSEISARARFLSRAPRQFGEFALAAHEHARG